MSQTKKILITGLIRNGENTIHSEVMSLKNAFDDFLEIHWLIIESDSIDKTSLKLKELSESIDLFRFYSLGGLSERMPLRTQRLAFCRNIYLDEIRGNPLYSDFEYVVVADLDGVNNLLTREGVRSCFQSNICDVCTANQRGNYYDIWALRHSVWCPGDCWEAFRYLNQFSLSAQDAANQLHASVYSKMIVIPENFNWVEVESAFGGMAIYKRNALLASNSQYIGLNQDGLEVAEHVSLHLDMTQRKYKIFINPSLINTDYTEHSIRFKAKGKRLLYV